MLVLLPWASVLALVAAAIASGIGARRPAVGPRADRLALGLVWAAAAASIASVITFARSGTGWLHSPWLAVAEQLLRPFGLGAWSDLAAAPPAWSRVFAGGPALDFDLRALILVCALTFALAIVMTMVRPPLPRWGWPTLIAASASLFVLSSGSPLGTVAAWLLLDLCMFSSGLLHRRGLLASQMGLWLLVAALAALPIDQESLRPAEGAVWEAAWLQLKPYLLGAAFLRMGLAPITWTLPRCPNDQPWRLVPTRIAPMLAGLSLVLRAATPTLDTESPYLSIVGLGLVALFAASFLHLGSSLGQQLDSLCMTSGALAILAAALTSSLSADLIVGLGIEMAFGRTLMVAGAGSADQPNDWAWTLGSLSALGLPGTLGFALRGPLLADWFEQLSSPWGLALLLGLTWTVWAWPSDAPSDLPQAARGPAWMLHVATASMALLGLAAGAVILFGYPAQLAAAWPAGSVTLGRQTWAALLLPPALGMLLRRSRRPGPSLAAPWTRPGRRMRLADVYDAWRSGLIQAGRVLHRSVNLMDSRRTMAWTLFAAMVIGLSMLTAPAGSSPQPLDSAWPLTVMAGALGMGILMAERPLVQLVALIGAQLLGAWVLIASPGPTAVVDPRVIAMVKLVTGWVVVGILTVGTVQQLDSDRSSQKPLEALLARQVGASSERRFLFGTAVLGFVLVLGIQSETLVESLPLQLLRPALLLISAGLLGTVFAEGALRLACSAYLIFIGLELVYARLDPGLLITGGLAVFQILFALMIAGFFGIDLGQATVRRKQDGP